MNTRLLLAAAALAAAPAVAQMLSKPWADAPELRLTELCNTSAGAPSQAILDASAPFRAEIVTAVTERDRDPGLVHSLWMPRHAQQTDYRAFENEVIIDYIDRFQDVAQITRELNADSSLAARGFQKAYVNGFDICFAALPPPPFVTVTEYYHPQMNHYRLSVGDTEGALLAADGWLATGESFRALAAGACYDAKNVFRFARSFGDRRGSRFLTLDAAECGQVRRKDPSWRPEDVPFFAKPPQAGMCQAPNATTAVYRLYNGRHMFNDANHRYTTSLAAYNEMIAQGWSAEGIAFCVAGQ